MSLQIPADMQTKPGEGLGIYSAGYHALGLVHVATAKARLAAMRGNLKDAAQLLRDAAEIHDHLGYIEPPRLHHPVRHCLAYVLLQDRQPQVRGLARKCTLVMRQGSSCSTLSE